MIFITYLLLVLLNINIILCANIGLYNCQDKWHNCLGNRKECGNNKGDTCFKYRNTYFYGSGTAPVCAGCAPKYYAPIVSYDYYFAFDCVLRDVLKCDELFIKNVKSKLGTKDCFMGGSKQFGILETYENSQICMDNFLTLCSKEKYGSIKNNNITNIVLQAQKINKKCLGISIKIDDILVRNIN
jgi:hypothetical protein